MGPICLSSIKRVRTAHMLFVLMGPLPLANRTEIAYLPLFDIWSKESPVTPVCSSVTKDAELIAFGFATGMSRESLEVMTGALRYDVVRGELPSAAI